MSRVSRNLILLLAIALGLADPAFATPTPIGSITITGAEQSSGSVWDTGTVIATLNGVSVSISYGQFSNPAGVAAGLAALISQNCNMPVYAQASGATINFYAKGSNVLSSATITSTSTDPSLFSGNSFLVNGGGIITAPQIVSMSLSEGPPSMGVTITGSNFGSTPGTVLIGGVVATVVAGTWSPNSIVVQVPNGLTAGPFPYTVVVETPTWMFNNGTVTFQVDDPFGCN